MPARRLLLVPFFALALAVPASAATPPPAEPPAAERTITRTMYAAGDIADDTNGDTQTAALLDRVMDGRDMLLPLGDTAYPSGTLAQFREFYAPTWGRHIDRTRPALGNHEYETPGASGYFTYFENRIGPRGYYSFNRGDWHLISLDSEKINNAQVEWLKADLAASDKPCTLAYWHHPRYDGSTKGDDPSVEPFWAALEDEDAEVVLNGHAHNYQRYGLIRGMRQFIVGTGGRGFYALKPDPRRDAGQDHTLGVLELDLGPGAAYSWAFKSVAGGSYTDTGTGTCS